MNNNQRDSYNDGTLPAVDIIEMQRNMSYTTQATDSCYQPQVPTIEKDGFQNNPGDDKGGYLLR